MTKEKIETKTKRREHTKETLDIGKRDKRKNARTGTRQQANNNRSSNNHKQRAFRDY